jgi:hypothetical protein
MDFHGLIHAFAQVARLSSEERRFFGLKSSGRRWLPTCPPSGKTTPTIAAEVERRFEAFKAGREKGLRHDEVFVAAKVLAA